MRLPRLLSDHSTFGVMGVDFLQESMKKDLDIIRIETKLDMATSTWALYTKSLILTIISLVHKIADFDY